MRNSVAIARSIYIGTLLLSSVWAETQADLQFDGSVRVGYQYHETPSQTSDEAALGLRLHAQKTFGTYFDAGATLYGVTGNGKTGFEGIPFFDEENRDYAVLAEGWLGAAWQDTRLRLGRQQIDTPFADSDDIGMVPNTFDALWMQSKIAEDTALSLGWLYRWGGVDAPTQRHYSKLNDNKGVAVAGISYGGMEDLSLSAWVYHASGLVTASYLEAAWNQKHQGGAYGLDLQGVYQHNVQSEDSRVIGVRGYYGHDASGMTATLSFNKTFGAPADNLWGGGPFFTNVEHNTLTQAGTDGSVLVLSLDWDGASAGIEDLQLGACVDRHLQGGNRNAEFDLTASYAWNDRSALSLVYSDVKTPDSFKNLRIFYNYTF